MGKLNKKNVIQLLKGLLTLVAFYFIFTKVPFNEVWGAIKEVNGFLLAIAFVLFVLSKLIASFRLNNLFKAIGITINNAQNIKLYGIGMFYNMFLPGGIGGDGYKVFVLSEASGDVPKKKVLSAILFDRLSGLLALAILCAVLYFFLPSIFDIPHYLGLILSVGCIGVLYVVFKKMIVENVSLFSKVSIQSFGVQIAQLICGVFLLFALGVDSNELIGYLFLFLVSSVVSVLPFTIGGLGAREMTFVYGGPILMLQTDVAIGMSLLFYGITALTSFVGGYFVLTKQKIDTESTTR